MSGEMDAHLLRYELDFDELKATEGYNPPDDFLIRELPLHAGGAIPGRQETKELLWYEYPSPFNSDCDPEVQEERDREERQLLLEEESLRQTLEEMDQQRQELEIELRRRGPVERQRLHQKESQRQRQRREDWEEETRLQLEEEIMRLCLEEESPGMSLEERKRLRKQHLDVLRRQRLDEIERQRLDMMQWQRLSERQRRLLDSEWHQLRQELDVLYSDEWQSLGQEQDDAEGSDAELWVNSDDDEPWPISSSSEHKFHVEELQVHMPETPSSPDRDAPEELEVHLQMYENDASNIPRYRLFNCEANTQELLLGFPLKIPYYIYAGRCNLKLEGYELRYAELFPNFDRWNHRWVRPTTYEGDDQYVDFFNELLGKVEYMNTKDRVLAKAITIANKGFRKILYFQIELAVGDCMMLVEAKEKFEQRCNLYAYIASEIYFQKQTYESVIERIVTGQEVLPYELTELGSDANEDDAVEMREFVDHLVRSTPIELPSTTRSDHVYKKWVSEQINLQFKPYFHLYLNYLVEKINMAQDLGLAPEDTS